MDTTQTWGATPDDWDRLTWLGAGLTADLLPVVSNPHAPVSPRSQVSDPGKVPSEYNRARQLRGLADWTARVSTDEHIEQWMQEPDYGICIQTRNVRAIDVDVTDDVLASEVMDFVLARLPAAPLRLRINSPKFLAAFRLPGELGKRIIHTEHGIIEFLANGQQFVAVGTHRSGVRYEWPGGTPQDFPTLSTERFEEIWSELASRFGVKHEGTNGHSYTPRLRGPDVPMVDELAEHLRAEDRVLREYKGGLVVLCPWADQHSSGRPGDGSTVYYPAGTKGYEHGAFKCLHGHCTSRTAKAFARAIGYVDQADTPEAEFGDLDDPEPVSSTPDKAPGSDQVDEQRNVFSPTDFPTIAAALREQRFGGHTPTLRRWRGLWYSHCGTHFRELDNDSLGVKVHRFLVAAKKPGAYNKDAKTFEPPEPFQPAKRHTEETLHALRSLTHLPTETAPSWAPGCERDEVSRGMLPTDIVSLGNGLFHLPTKTLIKHTPAFFTLNALPFMYDPHAQCPQWLGFLDTAWHRDPESIAALQEMIGYMLTADTSLHKLFALIGPPRCGKSLTARIITALVGMANVCGPTLRSLTTQFGLQPLIGKLVAIVGDSRGGGREVQAAVEMLLSISGEDTLTIDRKNKESWEGKLPTRLLVLSNETLSLPDASGALASRMIVLKFTESFLGREDTTLEARLKTELPGIFRWALEGRDRLAQRGYFIQPASAAETIAQMNDMNSPVRAFVEDCCVLDTAATVEKRVLYGAYRQWAIASGMNPPSGEIFGKNLTAAFPRITSTRPRGDDGSRSRHFVGIRLASVAEGQL